MRSAVCNPKPTELVLAWHLAGIPLSLALLAAINTMRLFH
jgi:hypothetical protein